MASASRVRITELKARKRRGEKIPVLTAYDATMAGLLERAGVDILLVGDSVGMAVRPEQRGIGLAEGGLDALAEAGLALGLAGSLSEAMQIVADAAGLAAGAEVVVVRVADAPV